MGLSAIKLLICSAVIMLWWFEYTQSQLTAALPPARRSCVHMCISVAGGHIEVMLHACARVRCIVIIVCACAASMRVCVVRMCRRANMQDTSANEYNTFSLDLAPLLFACVGHYYEACKQKMKRNMALVVRIIHSLSYDACGFRPNLGRSRDPSYKVPRNLDLLLV